MTPELLFELTTCHLNLSRQGAKSLVGVFKVFRLDKQSAV
jgi:hypothetical protein